MIYLGVALYLIAGFYVGGVVARQSAADPYLNESEDFVLHVIAGMVAGLFWPVVVLGWGLYRVWFPAE